MSIQQHHVVLACLFAFPILLGTESAYGQQMAAAALVRLATTLGLEFANARDLRTYTQGAAHGKPRQSPSTHQPLRILALGV
jgi:hypothetical protein